MVARRKRDTSEKRESIVRAAIEAFQAEGYDNTSMDRIAEVAGASKRTLYNHFPSKEALFEEVVERFLGEVSALKRIPYDPDRPLEDQLADFAAAKLRVLDDPVWLGLMRMGLGVFIRDPDVARETLARAEAGENHLAAWLDAATADGRLRVEDARVSAEVFWAMVSGGLFWPHVVQGPMPTEEAKALEAELIRTFLAGLEVTSGGG
jgi:TetR/AcrR family transcriptional regulator of autoinduction and epiphytic fitness